MKITPIYKNKILSLPYEIISEKLTSASKDELKVLLAVFSEPDFEPAALAERLDMTAKAFRRALEFWEKNNAIAISTEADTHVKLIEAEDRGTDEKLQKNNKNITRRIRYIMRI